MKQISLIIPRRVSSNSGDENRRENRHRNNNAFAFTCDQFFRRLQLLDRLFGDGGRGVRRESRPRFLRVLFVALVGSNNLVSCKMRKRGA